MILSVTLSKPQKNIESHIKQQYEKIKITYINKSINKEYIIEKFTQTQVFHEYILQEQIEQFINENIGKTFKNCVITTEEQIITMLANRKGKITTLRKNNTQNINIKSNLDKDKKYILQKNTVIPFLEKLGVMTKDGKVMAAKYDKFKQINRFLEFIDDIIDDVTKNIAKDKTLQIIDFGCGKSYLTFATHYYLTSIKKLNVKITGLDLKSSVVENCEKIARELNCEGLHFEIGDIANYKNENDIDIMITLHACDKATDYALLYAIKHNCKAILAVPCCQHEINIKLNKNKANKIFEPLLKYGIIKERFASLVTDALRAEYLEKNGYDVKLLEFINLEHTPKNILIRAIAKENHTKKHNKNASLLMDELQVSQALYELPKDL